MNTSVGVKLKLFKSFLSFFILGEKLKIVDLNMFYTSTKLKLVTVSALLMMTLAVVVWAATPVQADSVNVLCSGSLGSPTAVDEASLAGDAVTFISSGGTTYCELDAAISAASVTVGDGLSGNVFLTHPLGSTTGVDITTTGDFTIRSGSGVEASAKGCQGGIPGSINGYGPSLTTGICAQTTSGYGKANRGGAAHAGAGGTTHHTVNGQKATYGSSVEPTFLGSGGAGGPNGGENGGAGGGKVKLNVAGTLTVEGLIHAKGGAAAVASNGSGGGAGGSIHLIANQLDGAGTVSASGGDGYNFGGGGGGGRIAIYYDTLLDFSLANITASKGNKGASVGIQEDGQAGTTYILDRVTDDGVGTLTVTSGLNFQESVDYVRNNLVVYSGAYLRCDAFATLNVGASSTVDLRGVNWDCNSVDAINFSANSWLTSGANTLNFSKTGSTVDWDIQSDLVLNNVTYTGGTAGTLSANGGVLTLDNPIDVSLVNSDINSNLNWNGIRNLTIDADSSLLANTRGCAAGTSASRNGYGPNVTTGVCAQSTSGYGKSDRGGAAHAGAGGRQHYADSSQSTTYGSSTAPVLLGSGGGGGPNGGENGGAGGGKIFLDLSGLLTVNGVIGSNGGAGAVASNGAGGGSGGSVYVTTAQLGGSGSITARGGAASVAGGGGGGGRVALYYGALTDFNLSNLNVSGGPKSTGVSAVAGSSGSTYSLQRVLLSSVTITDNLGYTNDATPVLTLVSTGATPTHVALSCNAGANWSDWIAYPDDNVLNDDDGPVFDLTSGATGCSATNELKTISVKLKNLDGESSTISDTTNYDNVAPSVNAVSATNVDGTYTTDQVLTVTVQFSEPMAVTGTPTLLLDMDGTDRNATYNSLSTDTLSFLYTIVTGDNKSDLDYVGTDSLVLNGGSLSDRAGNVAVLTLPGPGLANSFGANKNIVVSTNQVPSFSISSVAQNAGAKTVTLVGVADDLDDDDTLSLDVEYSVDGGGIWAQATISSATASFGTPGINNALANDQVGITGAYLPTSSGANTVTLVWDAVTDTDGVDVSNAQIRVRPNDQVATGTVVTSADFSLDLLGPTGLTALNGQAATNQVSLTWSRPVDANFSHYLLYTSTSEAEVNSKTGTRLSQTEHSTLASIGTTSLTLTGSMNNLYIKIYAYDTFGNESTVPAFFNSSSSVTIGSGGGGGGGSSSFGSGSSSNDDDSDEPTSEDTDALDIDLLDHWSSGYVKYLLEDEHVVQVAISSPSFMDLVIEIVNAPDEGITRAEVLEFLFVYVDYPLDSYEFNVRELHFSDVGMDHPLVGTLQFAADAGLIQGYPDGTFQPDRIVNRAEALKLLTNFFHIEGEWELRGDALLAQYGLSASPFSDVDHDAWYASHVIHAYSKGVVRGYGDGTFGPSNPVTYAELLKIATLYGDLEGAVALASELEN